MATAHEKTIIISEAHLDSFGHLNNARYLELFEQARWDLITERGFGIDVIRARQQGPVILAVEMRFLRELNAREVVVIHSELVSYDKKVARMRQKMVKADGNLACEALFTFGLFDMQQRKLIEPTPEWSQAVGKAIATPGSAASAPAAPGTSGSG